LVSRFWPFSPNLSCGQCLHTNLDTISTVRSCPEFCVTGFLVSDGQSPFEVYGKLV